MPHTGRTLQEALALHQAGKLRMAAERYAAILRSDPGHEWATVMNALLAIDQERLDEGIQLLTHAAALFPRNEVALAGLGTAQLQRKDYVAAEQALRAALELSPDDTAVNRNLGIAVKNQGRHREALRFFRNALAAQRGYPAGQGALAPAPEMRRISGVKLSHDLDQLEFLSELFPDREDVARARKQLGEFKASHPELVDDCFALRNLNERDLGEIGWFYNRLLHDPAREACERAVSPQLDLRAAEDTLLDCGKAFVVLDDFLDQAALRELQRYCLEATIWFEVKDHGGHVGAYFDEGFDHDLILQVAKELSAAMPRVLGDARLTQAWAYKYDNRGGGTRAHADQALFTLNLWITPDGANLESSGGGLDIWDVEAPSDWDFSGYNADAAGVEAYIRGHAGRCTGVDYRENRAVLFRSRHFHRTSPFAFGSRYTDRRINISFLFGTAQ